MRNPIQSFAIIFAALFFLFASCATFKETVTAYDTIIANGKVIDGSGNPWFYADIAIRNGRIVKIGDLSSASADRMVDAGGLYVVPGFIDVHSHSGGGLTNPELSAAEPLLRQGLTTVFINPDGGGSTDITEQQSRLLKHGIGVNVAQLVPHGSVRRAVLAMEDRAPEQEELHEMERIVHDGMKAGAFGLSSGPFYAPGSYAETDELIALAKVAAEYNGVYTSHIRDESNYTIGLEAAVDEVIQVAREAELPGVVTHIKALGPPVWGLSEVIVENIEAARAEGVEVFTDQYPYTASATGLISALVPRWAEEGGRSALTERLDDPAQLSEIRAAMVENLARRGGADRIQFRTYSADPSIEGQTLADVAVEQNNNPIDTAIDLIRTGSPGIVSFNMDDEDVHRFMRQPWTMTSSDGGLVAMGSGVPHPRNYGTFPRRIRKYVQEDQITSLENAIRSMTSLPAQVFRLPDRGMLREGAIADIAVFDLERLTDKATFQEPHQLSEGVVYLFVNGMPAIEAEVLSEELYGRILKMNEGSY